MFTQLLRYNDLRLQTEKKKNNLENLVYGLKLKKK